MKALARILILLLIALFATSTFISPALADKHSAKDVCADDYWKWCGPQEAPFDCFKRRGFFKSDSLLSNECKRAWGKPKKEQVSEADPLQEAPKKLDVQSKRAPASLANEVPPQEVPSKKATDLPKTEPKPDDFSDLEFD